MPKKLGVILIVVGLLLLFGSQYVPPEQGPSSVDSQAVVNNPYLSGAANVSVANQLIQPPELLAELYTKNAMVGQLLGYADQSTFYVEVALQGAGFIRDVQAKDYRNASQTFSYAASQVALAYAIELALPAGPAVIAAQIILGVAMSGNSWVITSPARVQTFAVNETASAFSTIPGFIADLPWAIYEFVSQNHAALLFWSGVFAIIIGVVLAAFPRF